MSDKRKKYVLTSSCGIVCFTILLSVAYHCMDKGLLVLPVWVLGIFFCVVNIISLYVRDLFATSSKYVTSFYLIDKVVRFVASIMLIGILVYLYRKEGLCLGITSFVYYIMAMALELSYFFAVERKSEKKNA